MDNNNFKNILNIIEQIADVEDLLKNGAYNELRNKVQQDIKSIDDITNRDRSLNIGIVGEVKAGKSSFLNALLFKGEDILPKAPTPMTAALTKLAYSPEAYAKIVYYTSSDWQVIEESEQEYQNKIERKLDELRRKWKEADKKRNPQMPPKPQPTRESAEKKVEFTQVEKSCHQLVNLVKDNIVEKTEYLGKETILKGSNLLSELEKYVGSKGTLTPLVKYTEVYLDKEELRGIVIIDTPGLNDPITSRSTLTKDFLTHCDVVFLLSYVGQFFGQGDIDFLKKEIASASIKKAVLVGSKLDSGIIDYPRTKVSFLEAYKGSIDNYNKQARRNLSEAIRDGYNIPVLNKLLEEKNFYYISGLAYQVAVNMEADKPLGEAGELMLKNLSKFGGFCRDNAKFIKDFSGIDQIKRKVLLEVKKEKDKILAERIEDFAKNRTTEYLKAIDMLLVGLHNNINLLQNNDIDTLKQKKKAITSALNKSRIRIGGIFENEAVGVQRHIQRIKSDVRSIGNAVGDINVTTTSRTESRKEGGFFGLLKKTVYYEIEEKHASPSDVICSVQKFANEAESLINSEFNNMFELEKIKADIADEIIAVLKFTDDSIDTDDITIPIKGALNQLTISDIKVETTNYREKISTIYPKNIVKNEEIYSLQGLHKNIIFEFVDHLAEQLDKKGAEIAQFVKKQGSIIVDEIEAKCSNNLDALVEQINNKDKAIADHEVMINIVKRIKGDIATLQ